MQTLILLPAPAEADYPNTNHRIINYLRLSVTDRCNLRCIYCMPEEGIKFLPHCEILTYEEMLRVVSLCVENGIRKVRLTGGEPLVRKGIIPFIDRLREVEGLEEITLTTNGVLLREFARPLRECGICRVNVSMDTLRPERFCRITRRDCFDRVWEGIEEAEAVGLIGALSHHFCETCNRLRLTADGYLRGCLFSDHETDIKTPLRQGKGDGYLLDLITDTIIHKPENHGLDIYSPRKCVRPMNRIGG